MHHRKKPRISNTRYSQEIKIYSYVFINQFKKSYFVLPTKYFILIALNYYNDFTVASEVTTIVCETKQTLKQAPFRV